MKKKASESGVTLDVEGKRVEFKTKAAYAEWHQQRTGEKFK